MGTTEDQWTITGATILSMESGWEPRVGDVHISEGKITAIGPDLDPTGTVVDAQGAFLLPGFVDTHRHVWQSALRGLGPDFTGKDYYRAIRLHVANFYRPYDMYAGNYVGMLEAANSGVTTVLDHSHNVMSESHAQEAIRGSIDSGVRSVFAYGLNDPSGSDADLDTNRRLAFGAELSESELFSDQALVTFGVALADSWKSGQAAVPQGIELARDRGARISIHALGKRLLSSDFSEVRLLDGLGLVGADMVWVHMNEATDDELHRVLDLGGSVSVTPDAEAQMGMGAPVTGRVIRHGHLPGLGVDVVCSAPSDFLQTIRSALQCERLLSNIEMTNRRGNWIDEVDLKARTVLEAATVGGARALGLEDTIGTITVGKQADLILIESNGIGMLPAFDPVGAVVTQSAAADVSWVFVNGVPVKASGKLVQDQTWREVMEQSASHLRTQFDVRSPIPVPLVPLPD